VRPGYVSLHCGKPKSPTGENKLPGVLIRVNELIRGKRGVTPDTAWLLSKALGTSPEFWMNLQVNYELSSIDPPKGIKRLVAKVLRVVFDLALRRALSH